MWVCVCLFLVVLTLASVVSDCDAGLSGCASMFPCLFCLISADDLGKFGLESIERTLAFQNGLSTSLLLYLVFV